MALSLSFDIRYQSSTATHMGPQPHEREGTKGATAERARVMHSMAYETPRIDSAAKMRSSNPRSIISLPVRVSSKAFLTSVAFLLAL